MKPLMLVAVCAFLLVACNESNDEAAAPSTAEAAKSDDVSPGDRRGEPAARRPELRAFAMKETEAHAERVCGSVPPSILARTLGGADFPKTDTSPNAIALGYARDVGIRPIALQRAAYEGCEAGVTSQMAEAESANRFLEDCDRSPADQRWPDGVDGLTCKAAARVLVEWEFDKTQLSECEKPASAGFAHRASDGVSCDSVDDFAAHEFAPHPAGWIEKKGPTTCRIRQASGGGLLVQCVQSDGAFSFKVA